MPKVNPLVVWWNPKDIPEVRKGIDELPCDKLFMNYFPYPYNYTLSRKFFLEHTEYTHYVALPNDLVPTKEIYDKLVARLEKEDYPVLSGVCNVDMDQHKDWVNVCLRLPKIPYNQRIYRWLAESQRLNLLSRNIELLDVGFAGFPFMFIRRDIIQKIPFAWTPEETEQRPIWEVVEGWSGDLAFCTSCDYYKIPIKADLTCLMQHLRFHGKMLVGKTDPEIILVRGENMEKLPITEQIIYPTFDIDRREQSKEQIQSLRQARAERQR